MNSDEGLVLRDESDMSFKGEVEVSRESVEAMTRPGGYNLRKAPASKQRAETGPTEVRSIKRRRNSGDTLKSDEKPRVWCPFYLKDPTAYCKTVACRGKGFCEMGKLRDHLKDKHDISRDNLTRLNFKKHEFSSLKTIGDKLKLVFAILFPDVAQDNIPNPYVTHKEPLSNTNEIFKSKIFERFGLNIMHSIPMMAAEWNTIYEQSVKESAAVVTLNHSTTPEAQRRRLLTPESTPGAPGPDRSKSRHDTPLPSYADSMQRDTSLVHLSTMDQAQDYNNLEYPPLSELLFLQDNDAMCGQIATHDQQPPSSSPTLDPASFGLGNPPDLFPHNFSNAHHGDQYYPDIYGTVNGHGSFHEWDGLARSHDSSFQSTSSSATQSIACIPSSDIPVKEEQFEASENFSDLVHLSQSTIKIEPMSPAGSLIGIENFEEDECEQKFQLDKHESPDQTPASGVPYYLAIHG